MRMLYYKSYVQIRSVGSQWSWASAEIFPGRDTSTFCFEEEHFAYPFRLLTMQCNRKYTKRFSHVEATVIKMCFVGSNSQVQSDTKKTVIT